MNKPKIKLTNVKFFEGHDTMTGFNADIWINGIKCLRVHDSAYGGCYEYQNYVYNNPKAEQVRANIKLLNDYIETLPEKDIKVSNGRILKLKVDMDVFIEDYVEEYTKQKEANKQKKLMKTAILFGVPNGRSYKLLKFNKPLSELPHMILKNYVAKVLNKHCTNGEVILNTNLKELGIELP